MAPPATATTGPSLTPFVFDPDAEPPPERVFYAGFIAEGDLVMWVGREKQRKTNVILQLAICAALGRDFLQFRFAAPAPLQVVYVDYETKTASLKQRYQAICGALRLTEAEREMLSDNLKIFEIRKAEKEGIRIPPFPGAIDKAEDQVSLMWWQQFVKDHPADLYIFDPMRCLHTKDENDSNIERVLSGLRGVCKGAAVVVAHHMTKRGKDDALKLRDGMRLWSEGARGSGALKAHADEIVCQEQLIEGDRETVYIGAFGRDGPDVEPMPLEESDAESFYWQVCPEIPATLRPSFEALRKAGGRFPNKGPAARAILEQCGIKRASAYRHIDGLLNRGLLREVAGELVVQAGVTPAPSEEGFLETVGATRCDARPLRVS